MIPPAPGPRYKVSILSQSHLYISPVFISICAIRFECNAQNSHLGRIRVGISKKEYVFKTKLYIFATLVLPLLMIQTKCYPTYKLQKVQEIHEFEREPTVGLY